MQTYVMLQETRVLEEQLPEGLDVARRVMQSTSTPREKKGYAGVATLAKGDQTVLPGFAWGEDPDDVEGRVSGHPTRLAALREHLLAQRRRQPRAPSLQGAMDGRMAGMAGPLA